MSSAASLVAPLTQKGGGHCQTTSIVIIIVIVITIVIFVIITSGIVSCRPPDPERTRTMSDNYVTCPLQSLSKKHGMQFEHI